MKSQAIMLPLVTAIASSLLLFGGGDRVALGSQSRGVVSIWQIADGNERFSVSGKVVSVSYASNTVHISAGGQAVDILVTPTTVIEVHGESGSIADIRKGSKITASGVVRNGQKVALTIVLK